MKKSIFSICLVALITLGYSSQAQQNKTVSDTAGLRNEYTSVYNEITDLNAQLTTAQNNLAAYLLQPKAELVSNSNKTAVNQSAKNGKAKNAPVVENTKKEYEHASHAYNQGLNQLHDSIFILSSEINKKEQRLQQLSTSATL